MSIFSGMSDGGGARAYQDEFRAALQALEGSEARDPEDARKKIEVIKAALNQRVEITTRELFRACRICPEMIGVASRNYKQQFADMFKGLSVEVLAGRANA